ncbi:gp44 [Erwinia phage vB_EamM-Y2]|uniref:Gp44 n=1 Tax=Erwinia phage vB_EamM-Y2 TaxID=1051676 RepID=G0YPZ3_9CAUD|nr:gp44 [Erwinia phage vB_EamM-Y2]AEJ81420.1 gp44 [Erwinia phage vB_EamM-Y2]
MLRCWFESSLSHLFLNSRATIQMAKCALAYWSQIQTDSLISAVVRFNTVASYSGFILRRARLLTGD